MPEPSRPLRNARPPWLRALNPWLIVPAAVLIGLLLFLAVWLPQRQAPEETEAAILPTVTAERGPQPAPLPAPQLPEQSRDAAPAPGEGGVFVLPDAPPEPPAVAGEPVIDPATGPERGPADTQAAAGDRSAVPLHSPAPAYPDRALRRRLSGEVVIRALISPDGRPQQVEVAHSSSHRVLDQAALRAVRRWRFQPAMRHGEPVAQTVHVPVEFNP